MKVIKFKTKNCLPCRTLEPIFEKLKENYPNYEFITVDCEESPQLAMDYWIYSTPTIILQKEDLQSVTIPWLKPYEFYKQQIEILHSN